jgi:hypothetical protein
MFRTFLIPLYLVLLSGSLYGKHVKLTLHKAIEKRLVHAKASGNGGYQGYCIRMNVMNLTKDSIVLEVEAGMRLNSANDQEQDIMIVKQEKIYMRSLQEKNFNLKGFCCQASNRSPQKNTGFKLDLPMDSNFKKLGTFLSAGEFADDAVQQAVWSLSENRTVASITTLKDSSLLPLRQFMADLKGEKLPWYTVVSASCIYGNGVINNFPVLLRGKVKLNCGRDEYVTTMMYDKKGLPVCAIVSQWRKNGENICQLDLPVKGLDRGKYRIEMTGSDGVLLTEDVEL